MKKIFKLTILFVVVAIIAVSKTIAQNEQTIENLNTAITGETNASANYKAFSTKATEDGYSNIAKMFAAASAAEAIHVKNHNVVLTDMGKDAFNPVAEETTIKATADNIQAAIEGETYEFTVMYPGFITTATKEECSNALRSFRWASDAEAVHAKLYSKTLNILKTTGSDTTVASLWYTCPRCGNLFDTIEGVNRCPLCGAEPSAFLKF